MSKAKINSVNFDEMKINVEKAAESLAEAEAVWGDHFENLYYAFITNGFLDALYEDAKSTYSTWKKAFNVVSYIGAGALIGCKFTWIGGIIGAVIGAILGIWQAVTTDPTWLTVSKEAFENLLTNCVNGNDDCYIGMTNIGTKLFNVQLSMEEIRTKINEFNHTYASFQESMDELGLKGTMSDDGVLLSIDTEITVNGEKYSTSVSEALNAFYTYQNTVMASRIEAGVLAEQYGIDIDYDALVQNANGFIVNTLDSGLYSHEFITGLLPTYSIDQAGATSAAAGSLGISTDDFKSALAQAAGIVGVGAGLVGASFIGNIGVTPEGGDIPPDTPTDTPEEEEITKGPTDNPNDDPSDTPTETPSVTPGGTTTTVIPGGTTIEGTGTTPEETKPEEEVKNDIEIDKIDETELPEKVETTIEKDYDDIARREFEEMDKEEIAERREKIMNEIDDAYSSGDFSDIKAKLKDYGYSDPEIASLLKDRDKLSLALISGDQKAFMADRAMELAKADGVENFESIYSGDAEYSDLTDGTANSIIVNMSDDKEVSAAFESLTSAEEVYTETVKEAAAAVEAAVLAKTTVTTLQEKFTKEFGTSDTTKWSKEAAEEYKEAVDDYNKKAKDASDKLKKNDEAKEDYEEAKEDYEKAKVDFEDRVKDRITAENENADENNDSNSTNNNENNNGTGNNGNSNNNGYTGFVQGNGYVGVDEQFPGLASHAPTDNSLYAQENLGANGVYTETVQIQNSDGTTSTVVNNSLGAPIGQNSTNLNYVNNNVNSGAMNSNTNLSNVNGGNLNGTANVVGNTTVTQSPGVGGTVLNGSNAEVGGVYFNAGTDQFGNSVNNVTISDAELLAALSIAEEEAKFK